MFDLLESFDIRNKRNLTTSKHRLSPTLHSIEWNEAKEKNFVNFDWIWINNAHIDQRLTVELVCVFLLPSCSITLGVYSHLYQKRCGCCVFFSLFSFNLYEFSVGLWMAKWLMAKMEYIINVNNGMTSEGVFCALFFKFSIDFKVWAVFLSLPFVYFPLLLIHTNFDSVLVLSEMM